MMYYRNIVNSKSCFHLLYILHGAVHPRTLLNDFTSIFFQFVILPFYYIVINYYILLYLTLCIKRLFLNIKTKYKSILTHLIVL